MPSNRTPMGLPETAPNGNAGAASKSQKLSNGNAEQIRAVRASGSAKFTSQVQTDVVQPSNAGPAQAPKSENVANVIVDTAGESTQLTDSYRFSDDPANTPSRQLGEAEEDRPAAISVRANDGNEIISSYASFMLQSVSEAEQEKYQIVETFTAYYTFFFGKRPPVYRYSGILLNDQKHNWMNTFRFMYENYFRGTATAEFGAETVVTYDKRAISGFLLSLNIQQDAAMDKGVPFSFDMLVVNHNLVGFSSDFDAFIQQQQDRLRQLREASARDIAELNKAPNSLQQILKNSVLQGKKPTASAKKTGTTEVAKPETKQATNKPTGSKGLAQEALDADRASTKTTEISPGFAVSIAAPESN